MVTRWCEILEFWNSMSTAQQYKDVFVRQHVRAYNKWDQRANKKLVEEREDPFSAGGKEAQAAIKAN